MKRLLILFNIFLMCLGALSQTGPAGVGGHEDDIEDGEPINALWLRAEDLSEDYTDGEEVTSWEGTSEYGHEAVVGFNDIAAPLFKENKINGFPWVEFAGDNYFLVEDHKVLDGGMGIAIYCVLQQWIENSGTIVSKGIHWNFFSNHQSVGRILTQEEAQHAYDMYFDSKGKSITTFINGNLPDGSGQDVFTDTVYGDDDQTYLIDYVFNKNWGGTIRVNGDVTVKPGRSEGNPNPITLGEDPVYDGTVDLRIGVRYWDPAGWQNPEDPAYTAFMQGGISELIMFKGELDSTQMILVENYLATKYNISLKEEYELYTDSMYIHDFIGIGTQTGGDVHPVSSRAGFIIEEMNESIDSAGEYLLAAHNGSEIEYVDSNMAVDDMERWTRIWNMEKKGEMDVKVSFDFFEAGITMDDVSTYSLLYRASDTAKFMPIDIAGSSKFRTLSFEVTNDMLKSGQYTLGHEVESSGGGTSIVRQHLSDAISVFPNPVANELLNININAGYTGQGNLRVMDYTGKELYSSKFIKTGNSVSMTVPVSKFDSGVYFIEITINNLKGIKTFIRK